MGRILYMTDKFGVSSGYAPAFEAMLRKCGIQRGSVALSHIYNVVEKPLIRKGQEKTWKFDPEKLDKIRAAFVQRVRAIRPDLIVVSCPALLGVLAEGDSRIATIEKMRGGVYQFEGITTIVAYPITAINQRIDSRLVENDDGEQDTQQPYRVKDGAKILRWDWEKVGRFHQGKHRRLPPFKYSICRTLADCFAAREYLADCKLIAVDIETGNYPPGITCVGYTGLRENGAAHSFVIPFFDSYADGGVFWASPHDHEIAWSVVRDINESPVPKTLQNGAYDATYFVRDRLGLNGFYFDSQIMWWSLYMELPKRLDFISSVLCDNYQYWKDDIKGDEDEKVDSRLGSMERYWRYNALDCYYTLFNTLYLNVLLQKNQAMATNYNYAMMRMFSGFQMSLRGLKADFDRMDYHRRNLVEAMEDKTDELRYLLDDPEFNINSGQQKNSLLYDVFGLRERTARGRFVDQNKPKKGTNAPSSGAIPLKMAKSEHPLFRYIIEKLQAALEPRVQLSNVFGYPDSTVKSGYRGGLFLPSGRFRYALNAVGTETERFSGKKSNLWDGGNPQNIRGTYRDWLVADDDHLILDVDYSQSDDVFIAYESQDPDKIAVVESGLDAHAVNGELFFGRSYDSIVAGKRAKDPDIVHPITGIRQLSKRIVHGTNFQMAGMTLYVTMGREAVVGAAQILGFADAHNWDQNRLVHLCEQLMAKYRKKYRRLTKKEWYAEIAKTLETKGSITNAFGTTRLFLGDPADNGTQREATSFYGQSDTAGNMNRVMYEVDHGFIPKRFRDGPNPHYGQKPYQMSYESHGFRFHLQVHDNFVSQLSLKHPRWKEAAANLLRVMDRPVIIHGREVRVKAEAEVGLRWGKNMLEWDGKDVHDLDRLTVSLRSQEQMLKGN